MRYWAVHVSRIILTSTVDEAQLACAMTQLTFAGAATGTYGAVYVQRQVQTCNTKRESAHVRTPTRLQRTLPNILTAARVVCTPLLAIAYLSDARGLATGIFALSAVTDLFDGILARRWNVCSALGAFLDPVADKLLVCAALVCVVARLPTPYIAPATAVILCREIFVSALREWMATRNMRDTVQVGFLGKVKTAAQMVAVIALLAAPEPLSLVARIGALALIASAVLAIVSAAGYVRAALPVLLAPDKPT